MLLNIQAEGATKPVGLKSVKQVKDYDNGGRDAIARIAETHIAADGQTLETPVRPEHVNIDGTDYNVEGSNITINGTACVVKTRETENAGTEKYIIYDGIEYIVTTKTSPIVINDALKSVDQIKKYIISQYNLPLKSNVLYTDGTSTGGLIEVTYKDATDAEKRVNVGGTNLPVSIVWDDSRIKLTQDGTTPNGNDNYLYGWVQNKLIAKIPVVVSPKYELKKVTGYEMADLEEQQHVRLSLQDKLQNMGKVINGFANLQIEMDTFYTKNLPKAITIKHASGERTYTTTAVKRIVYKPTAKEIKDAEGTSLYGYLVGKEYKDQIDENLSVIYDATLGREVAVDKVGWQGDWYYSKDRMTDRDQVAGKLVWDTSQLAWDSSNPYILSETAGNGTVSMKLITGQFDDYVLPNIKVIAKYALDSNNVIDAIKRMFNDSVKDNALNINLLRDPDFIHKLKNIAGTRNENGATVIYGTGINNVDITQEGEKNTYSINLDNSSLSFNFVNLNTWLARNDSRYKGASIDVPVTITRTINNPAVSGGKENIKYTFTLKVNIEKVEIDDAKLTLKRKVNENVFVDMDVTTELNPYKDFVTQIQAILANNSDVIPYITLFARNARGAMDPIQIRLDYEYLLDNTTEEGTNIVGKFEGKPVKDTSFNLNGNARVKLDVASIYNTYGKNGTTTFMKVYVGTAEHGYLPCELPIRIAKKDFRQARFEVGDVDLMNATTLSNNDKELGITVENIGDLEILWFDKETLINLSNANKTNFDIDAIIGFKQQGLVVKDVPMVDEHGNPIYGEDGITQRTQDVTYVPAETANNKFLNKRVKLHVSTVNKIISVRVLTYGGSPVEVDKYGNYVIPTTVADVNAPITYTYLDSDGNGKTLEYTGQRMLNLADRSITIKIGVFEKKLYAEDTYTNIVSIQETGRRIKDIKTGTFTDAEFVNRAFTTENGVFTIKYGFSESLPFGSKYLQSGQEVFDTSKVTYNIVFTTPDVYKEVDTIPQGKKVGDIKLDATGKVVMIEVTQPVELHQSVSNPNVYEGEFAYKMFTYKIVATK